MLKRLMAVVLVYATRRLLWLSMAGYVAFAAAAYSWSHKPTHQWFDVITAAPPSVGKVVSQRNEVDSTTVALNCQTEWGWTRFATGLNPPSAYLGEKQLKQLAMKMPLPEIDHLPNLRVLDLTGCVLFPEDTERLGRCRSLEWLKLSQNTIVNQNDLRFLSGLKHLRTLVLETVVLFDEHHIRLALPPLPELTTVSITDSPGQMAIAIQSLRESPRLNELILRPETTLNNSVIADLRSMGSLQRVFIAGYHGQEVAFGELRAALPDIHVSHLQFDVTLAGVAVVALFMLMLVMTGVAGQVSATFSVPQARLLPQYAVPHLLVSVAIVVSGLAAQTWLANRFGADIWSMLSLQIFVLGAWSSIGLQIAMFPRTVRVAGRSEAPVTGWAIRLPERTVSEIRRIVVLVVLFGSLAFLGFNLSILNSFLRGELVWVDAALLATGCILSGVALVSTPRLSVWAAEAGLPLLLSFRDVEQRRHQWTGLGFHGWQRRLENLPKQPDPPSWWWRVRALRAGNSLTIISRLLLFGVPMTFMVYLTMVVVDRLNAPNASRGPADASTMIALILGVMIIAQAFGMWHQRTKTLERVLLYPWTRRELTVAILLANAVEVGFVVAILTAIDWSYRAWFNAGLETSILAPQLIALAGFAVLLTALEFSLLTVRQIVYALLLAYGGLAVVFGIVIASAAPNLMNRQFPDGLAYLLTLGGIECALIAAILGVFAYRRWMRMEWGLVANG